MRKQLLAFFSALGLAGSATPGTAQVLKGAASPTAKVETQQKSNNSDKSILIGLSQPSDTTRNRKKSDKSVLIGLSQASDTNKKLRKAGGEQQLQRDALVKKQFKGTAETLAGGEGIRDKRHKLELENDAAGKQQTVKLTNALMGDGSVRNGSNAAQSEAKKKADQASPKL